MTVLNLNTVGWTGKPKEELTAMPDQEHFANFNFEVIEVGDILWVEDCESFISAAHFCIFIGTKNGNPVLSYDISHIGYKMVMELVEKTSKMSGPVFNLNNISKRVKKSKLHTYWNEWLNTRVDHLASL